MEHPNMKYSSLQRVNDVELHSYNCRGDLQELLNRVSGSSWLLCEWRLHRSCSESSTPFSRG